MNENAKKLVAALRSGEYRQGQSVLHNNLDDSFCCLGVACDIYMKENGGRWLYNEDYYNGLEYLNQWKHLPNLVQKWLGFATPTGDYYQDDDYLSSLVELNDSGKSFDEIADVIESEPLGLFENL